MGAVMRVSLRGKSACGGLRIRFYHAFQHAVVHRNVLNCLPPTSKWALHLLEVFVDTHWSFCHETLAAYQNCTYLSVLFFTYC
jgi:hypothetical protein